MDRARVLVVEDRPSVLQLMATVLERAHEVLTASDGTAAVEIIRSEPLDVVLTDIRMPGLSGFDVLRAVERQDPHVEVVMMTAYANVADAVAAIKLGAYDYVAKPIDADEISLVVARAVEHRRERERQGWKPAPGGEAGPAGKDGEPPAAGFRQAVEAARDRASRDYLVGLMRAFQGNVTSAARQAGMTRESLHRVMKKYGVRSEEYRAQGGNGHGPEQSWPP